jgi:alpha-galactosidase
VDTTLNGEPGAEFTLHRNKGDNCTADSFEPIHEPLSAKADVTVANTGGRPTQVSFPYFNVQAGGQGFIFALSWAGQWSTRFTRDEGTGLRIRAGQEKTHFLLHPGEEVRGPMAVIQFYEGTRTRAQNVWRQWMIAHNTPRPGGKLPPLPQLNACSSHQFGEMVNANSDSQIFFVDKYLEQGMKLDYWWMDAGWYPCDGQWPKTGTWEVDQARFPGGFKPISDHAHGKDVKIIVWFEPERVAKDTWLTENHPDWILGGKKGGLLNLGNDEARTWLIEHVDKLMMDNGIDLYRQDFNMDPLDAWRKNDTPDRQGITEIRHIEGYFAYWDALRQRHPDMLIDSCASGGRRNDLETLRRAVPLLRSDYIMEPVGNQCHTWTLSEWFPFYGTGTSKTDPYLIRSILCPSQTACWDQRDDKIDFAAIRGIIDEWKAFAPNYFGDYYPITPYSLAADQWIGWQFDRPEAGEGLIQVFRRDACPYESAQLPLQGLTPAANYRVVPASPLNPGEPVEMTGADLMDKGLSVAIPSKPGWAFFTYKRV